MTATDLAGNVGPAANVTITHDSAAADAPAVAEIVHDGVPPERQLIMPSQMAAGIGFVQANFSEGVQVATWTTTTIAT